MVMYLVESSHIVCKLIILNLLSVTNFGDVSSAIKLELNWFHFLWKITEASLRNQAVAMCVAKIGNFMGFPS